MKKVIVIGAGIIGASLAYHLAKSGADVLVLDEQVAEGGVATPHSWAWINASWGNPPDYVSLRMRSMAEWRHLAKVDDDLGVDWNGGLLWDLPEEQLQAYVNDRKAVGYEAELVDGAAAQKHEPKLKEVPNLAVYAKGEGAIEPVSATRGFLRAAKTLGANVVFGAKVEDFVTVNGRITGVRASGADYMADETVIAAGAQTAILMTKLGVKLNLEVPPGLLVHSVPCEKILNGLVMSPQLHVRQTASGRLVAGSDFGGAQPGDDPAVTADVLFAHVREFLRGAENLKMDFFTLGHRPTPADGVSVIGRPSGAQGLYVVVTHSGVTLAPALGMLGAAEIVTDTRDELLHSFHPDRLCS